MVMIQSKLIGTAPQIADLLDEPALNTVDSENVRCLRLSVIFHILKQSCGAHYVWQQA